MEFTAQQIEQLIDEYTSNTVNDLSFRLGRILLRTSETMELVDMCVTYGTAVAHMNMLFVLPQQLQRDLLHYAKAWFDYVCINENITEPQWMKERCMNYLSDIIEHFEPDETTNMDF